MGRPTKKENLRTLLGLTQMEMAVLIGVNRAQWSMFESGVRHLPGYAGLRLAKIEKEFYAPEQKAVREKSTQHLLSREQLLFLKKENDFAIETLERKINPIAAKLETQRNLNSFAQVLSDNKDEKLNAFFKCKLPMLDGRDVLNLPHLYYQMQLLEYERSHIERQLKDFND